jgi:putative ABC transport system substrate-binding protein
VKRREFIAGLGGVAMAWPVVARAQQAGKLPIIGFLGAASAAAWRPYVDAFVERLAELGWSNGRTVAFEYRWDEGRPELDTDFAAEFARLNVAVIVTAGFAVPAIKRVTSTVPIVFALALDPVGDGLVASLARPGGNVTGLSNQSVDLAGKRVELLRDVVPQLRRLAVLVDAGFPHAVLEMREVQATARALGIEVVPLEIRRAEDIGPVFEGLKAQGNAQGNAKADALYVVTTALVSANRTRIIELAVGARLPTIFITREYVQAGALMSYGPNYSDLFRRSADHVDKILRGAKPGDIPVEQPTKFDLAVNLKAAKALGLTIPSKLLFTADEVIE